MALAPTILFEPAQQARRPLRPPALASALALALPALASAAVLGSGCAARDAHVAPNYEPTLSAAAGGPVYVLAGTPAAYHHFILADVAYQEERWEEARTELRLAVAYDPDSAYLEARLADVLVHMGRVREALSHADRAVKLGPTQPYGYVVRGWILVAYRRLDEAVASLERALGADPEIREAWLLLAIAHLQRDDRAAARRAYLGMAVAFPDSYEPFAHLAELAIGEGDDTAAMKHLADALEREPALPEAARRLGMLHEKHGDRAGALAVYEAALGAMPDLGELRVQLVRLLLAAGRNAEADAHVAALRVEPLPDAVAAVLLRRLGRVYLDAGRAEMAASLLEEARTLPGGDPDGEASFHLGAARAALHQNEAALAAWAAVPERSQVKAAALAAMAALRLGEGNLAEAERLARAAVKLDPTRAEGSDSLGRVYLAMGRVDEALKLIESATRLSPGEPEFLEHLGDVLVSAKDVTRARAAYEKALGLAPEDDGLRASLARKIEAIGVKAP
ncbi:MAG TPA: tetratricopeptide repeat protein [Myxococcota bacterium]|jgi:tetratricopeptide (TPR) repeat protein|nr:tetratricopeptide repeat protein [Myxococcota bacterium]